eukprot:scaffold19439_cov136-Isochrysis_galbana.AAC.2
MPGRGGPSCGHPYAPTTSTSRTRVPRTRLCQSRAGSSTPPMPGCTYTTSEHLIARAVRLEAAGEVALTLGAFQSCRARACVGARMHCVAVPPPDLDLETKDRNKKLVKP